MGHFVDFLDSLLGDNVMNDYEKIVRQMSHAEAQSKILNQDYRYRIANAQSEVLAFDKITKDKTEQYLISSEAITEKSRDCMFPTLTRIESQHNISMIYPIIKAFSEQS